MVGGFDRVMRGAKLPLAVAAAMALIYQAAMAQQPCNPVIDGTHCATQPGRYSSSPSGRSTPNLKPIQSIASDIMPDADRPATLGAINFRADSNCIGLFRRGACN
jgi:hypothetical protein